MHTRGAGLLVTCAAALAIVAGACGSSGAHAKSATSLATSTTRATTPPTTRAPTTTRVTRPPSTLPPSSAAPTTAAPTTVAPTTPTTAAAPTPLLVTQLPGIGSAGQVITVAASGYGTSVATVAAYQRNASGWTQVFGPWEADIGRNGVAPPGAKREGDGRTPSGTFGFDFMFGVYPNPGVHFPFRSITGPNIVWDDDPASPNYNEWIDTNSAPAGANPEPMDVGAYDAGAVIAYNDARTPGLGSAIFLHVSSGRSTAGCVALPYSELLEVLRWLEPGRGPLIVIGTQSSITS